LNVFEHLIELDKDGTLVPGLSTHWQWLNNRTLEFTLRQGVQFHNGEVFDGRLSSSTGRRICGYGSRSLLVSL
jgi:peptide/nickel transport system substrate-binding protein